MDIESCMQVASVKWFRETYPHLGMLLFSIPNGGWRHKKTAARMVEEGMLKGAADLMFLFPSDRWLGLAIEFKSPGRRPSEAQLSFGSAVMGAGYLYRVVYSQKEFERLMADYLRGR